VSTAGTRIQGIKGQNFSVDVEYNSNFVFIHLTGVTIFNASTLKEMDQLLKNWWLFIKTAGYKGIFAHIPNENIKVQRLVYKLGFKKFLAVPDFTTFIYTGDK
jgi:hypothetical protein